MNAPLRQAEAGGVALKLFRCHSWLRLEPAGPWPKGNGRQSCYDVDEDVDDAGDADADADDDDHDVTTRPDLPPLSADGAPAPTSSGTVCRSATSEIGSTG